jgi:hypothetical protein
MVITPSLPTFSIAFAMSSPISLSPLADIVPTFKSKKEDIVPTFRKGQSINNRACIHRRITETCKKDF